MFRHTLELIISSDPDTCIHRRERGGQMVSGACMVTIFVTLMNLPKHIRSRAELPRPPMGFLTEAVSVKVSLPVCEPRRAWPRPSGRCCSDTFLSADMCGICVIYVWYICIYVYLCVYMYIYVYLYIYIYLYMWLSRADLRKTIQIKAYFTGWHIQKFVGMHVPNIPSRLWDCTATRPSVARTLRAIPRDRAMKPWNPGSSTKCL